MRAHDGHELGTAREHVEVGDLDRLARREPREIGGDDAAVAEVELADLGAADARERVRAVGRDARLPEAIERVEAEERCPYRALGGQAGEIDQADAVLGHDERARARGVELHPARAVADDDAHDALGPLGEDEDARVLEVAACGGGPRRLEEHRVRAGGIERDRVRVVLDRQRRNGRARAGRAEDAHRGGAAIEAQRQVASGRGDRRQRVHADADGLDREVVGVDHRDATGTGVGRVEHARADGGRLEAQLDLHLRRRAARVWARPAVSRAEAEATVEVLERARRAARAGGDPCCRREHPDPVDAHGGCDALRLPAHHGTRCV